VQLTDDGIVDFSSKEKDSARGNALDRRQESRLFLDASPQAMSLSMKRMADSMALGAAEVAR
jgi:hypothetical protein